MSARRLAYILAGLVLLVIGLALYWQPAPPRAAGEPPPGGDFTLQSADGPVSLADYRGKVVLIYFGYTYCPDICPTELAGAAAGLRSLAPEEAARVAVFFVSVDPERDTPARLKSYAAFFHPAMLGLTGSPSEVAAVARRYGAYFARQPAGADGAYAVDHSSVIYVVGPDGRLAGRIPHGASPPALAEEIRRHLRSRIS